MGRGGQRSKRGGFFVTVGDYYDAVMPYLATAYMFLGAIIVVFGLFLSDWLIAAVTPTKTYRQKMRLFHQLNWLFHTIIGVVMVNLNPFWSRKVDYEIPIKDLPKSAIYVANHLSFADAFVFPNAIKQEFVVVARAATHRDPAIIGAVQRLSGVLRVYFEETDNAEWHTHEERTEIMMRKAVEKLDEGVSILVFSEGTIPDDGEMVDFKPGMYRLGLRTNTPCIPMGSWGTQYALPMGDRDEEGWVKPQPWAYPSGVIIKAGQVVEPWDFDLDQYHELIEKAIQDDGNDLVQEDFEESNREKLGERVYSYYEKNDSATHLMDALADNYLHRVRDQVAILRGIAKKEWEKKQKKRLKSREEWDQALDNLAEFRIQDLRWGKTK